MFLGRNARTVISEGVGYLFVDWDGFVVKGIVRENVNMKWMAATKAPDPDTGTLNFTATDSSEMSNIDVVNDMKFTNVVNDHEHLKLYFCNTTSC